MAVAVAAEPVLAAPPQVAQHLKDNAAQRKTTDATAPGDTGSPNSQPLETLAEEKAALVALYNATDGANWTNKTNWLTNVPVGQWHGVITDAKGRVTDLDLSHNGLTGEIPAELGILPKLQWLNLSWNELTAEIPDELGSLTKLTYLDLPHNGLTGETPAELGDLTKLQWLNLSWNELTGEVPDELGSLTNLKDLFLWGNELTGEIPAELGNLTKLQWLNLSENELTGEIPAELASLVKLQKLSLSANELTGEIPDELGSLTRLTDLGLSHNGLTGEIPAELGSLVKLQRLNLTGNQLSGEIPAELGSLTNLEGLYLRDNLLTGEIPAELGNLTNLQWLSLRGNLLTGCVPAGLRDVEQNDFAQLGLPFCYSATRSFSATTVAPGDEITVNIALGEYGRGGSVTETLPEGFTFVSGSLELTGGEGSARPSGNVVNVVLAGAGVTNVAYKVTAPTEAGGPFTFTGEFANFDGESVDIGGASTVTVAADAGTPASYDSNGNGIIELSELFDAIEDYFSGEISLTVLFDIIEFYFSGDRVG